VDAVIQRQLAKDPAQRYPNARGFALALGAVLRGAASQSVPVVAAPSTSRPVPIQSGETVIEELPPLPAAPATPAPAAKPMGCLTAVALTLIIVASVSALSGAVAFGVKLFLGS
jgi:hypothetical protein